MNAEKLKSKVYRRRRWSERLPLYKTLNELEKQVEDITRYIIEDLIYVDTESGAKIEEFKTEEFNPVVESTEKKFAESNDRFTETDKKIKETGEEVVTVDKNLREDLSKIQQELSNDIANAQSIAEEAMEAINIIADDNIIDVSEKQQISLEVAAIDEEYPDMIERADSFEVSSTDYKNKYSELKEYITPILEEMEENSEVSGIEFRFKFQNYYNSKQNLLNIINSKNTSKIIEQLDEKIIDSSKKINERIDENMEGVSGELEKKAYKTELHNHINKQILDSITRELIDIWNGKAEVTDLHSHLNKTVLDSITQLMINNWNGKAEVSDLHDHGNKTLLDKLTQSMLDSWNSKPNTSDLHGHSNKTILDTLTTEKMNQWDNKAERAELHEHENMNIISSITAESVTEWNSKPDMSIIEELNRTISTLIEQVETLRERVEVLENAGGTDV